jgi:hypothetical protein
MKKTLIFCFCLVFAAFAKATTLTTTPLRDTFISSIILLRNGDTLKVCDAKAAENDIEFRYCDRPKRIKIINKAAVLRVVIGNNKLIFENPILKPGQIIKPKLAIVHPLFSNMDEFMMGNTEVNPYVFEKELVPNIKAGEARREAVHRLYKKAQASNGWVWALFGVGVLLLFLNPVASLIAIGLSTIPNIIGIVQIVTARKQYSDMVDDYNANQGYN